MAQVKDYVHLILLDISLDDILQVSPKYPPEMVVDGTWRKARDAVVRVVSGQMILTRTMEYTSSTLTSSSDTTAS